MRINTDSSPVEVMESWTYTGQYDDEHLTYSKNYPVKVLYWKGGRKEYNPTTFYCADMRIAKSVRLGLLYGGGDADIEILDFRNSD